MNGGLWSNQLMRKQKPGSGVDLANQEAYDTGVTSTLLGNSASTLVCKQPTKIPSRNAEGLRANGSRLRSEGLAQKKGWYYEAL